MNFEITVDREAEIVTIVFDDSIVLKVSKLEDESFRYSNFHKIEDEGELAEEIKKFAIGLLSFI